LFCADLESFKEALKTVHEFGRLAGLALNVKKSKAMWLGKWVKNKRNPLNLKWCAIQYVYKGFMSRKFFFLKIHKLEINLDKWRARNLTLFGRVLIIKSIGLSQLVYSAPTLNVPKEIIFIIKTKLFCFLWNNKKNKIKRQGLCQDKHKGGLRMVVTEKMFNVLKLAGYLDF